MLPLSLARFARRFSTAPKMGSSNTLRRFDDVEKVNEPNANGREGEASVIHFVIDSEPWHRKSEMKRR